MAYVSLYRKYRPQTFAEVVGQEHVTQTLAQSVESDRLHHAYLFTGPRGTGKTSTARILAKSINCEQGPTAQPDGTCTHCRAITSGSSIDVIEIDAASHGGVDDVRDLRDRVAFAPASARMKVYIVDECHMLSTAGWNAFLKTVEEPPGHVIFVFATTEPHKVLDTILSRTQRFDFKRIPAAALAAHIRSIGELEGMTFSDGAVDLIVDAGDGSARDAMSVLEQVAAFTGAHVTTDAVTDVLGSSPHTALDEMVAAMAAADVAATCRLVQRLADAGQDLRQFAKDAVEHLRAVFMTQVAPDAGLVTGTPERIERLRGQSGRLGQAELLRAMELLGEAQAQMRRGNTRLPLEIALAKAALPHAATDPDALLARLERLERRTAAPPAGVPPPASVGSGAGPPPPEPTRAAEAAPPRGRAPAEPAPPRPEPAAGDPGAGTPVPTGATPAAPDSARTGSAAGDGEPTRAARSEAPPAVTTAGGGAGAASPDTSRRGSGDLSTVAAAWPAVLDRVKQASKRVHAMATLATPADVSPDGLTLRFPAGYGFHAEQCGSEKSQEIIGAALNDVVGFRSRLRCVVEDGQDRPPAVSETEDAARVAAEAEAVAESEAAEEAGDVPDPAEVQRRAVALVERDLGGRVLDGD